MKCTSKIMIKKVNAITALTFLITVLNGCRADTTSVSYASIQELTTYNQEIYRGDLFATDLCVTTRDVPLENYSGDPDAHAAGLFDINNRKVLYADRIFNRIYPASTTKVLTAYIALKYGNPDDLVTVSENAVRFDDDASLANLRAGDQLTLYDLLCGLTLPSGNDAAVAIAEHISGSVESFAELMNSEANALGATGSHFVNPHGLHDANHYTTAYDLYLFFQAAIQDVRYTEILRMTDYTASITGADGTVRSEVWEATNFYSAGIVDMPEGIRVLGGKTGTTDEAGNCVILYNEDLSGNPYISVIMGASDKAVLYDNMSRLLSAGILQS